MYFYGCEKILTHQIHTNLLKTTKKKCLLLKSIGNCINECPISDLKLPVIDISSSVKLSTGLKRMELYENNTASQKANISTVKKFLCGPLFTDFKRTDK